MIQPEVRYDGFKTMVTPFSAMTVLGWAAVELVRQRIS